MVMLKRIALAFATVAAFLVFAGCERTDRTDRPSDRPADRSTPPSTQDQRTPSQPGDRTIPEERDTTPRDTPR